MVVYQGSEHWKLCKGNFKRVSCFNVYVTLDILILQNQKPKNANKIFIKNNCIPFDHLYIFFKHCHWIITSISPIISLTTVTQMTDWWTSLWAISSFGDSMDITTTGNVVCEGNFYIALIISIFYTGEKLFKSLFISYMDHQNI